MEELNCMKIATLSGGKWDNTLERSCRVYSADAISPTVVTCTGGGQDVKILDKDTEKSLEIRLLSSCGRQHMHRRTDGDIRTDARAGL